MADVPVTTAPVAPEVTTPAPAPAAPVSEPVAAATTPQPVDTPPASPPAAASADSSPADAPIAEAAKPAEPVKQEFPATAMEAGKADAKPAEPVADAKPADAPADAPVSEVPGEPAAAEAPAPTYAFTWPEDIKAESVSKERLDAFTAALAESKVPPEKAQAYLDMHLAELREATKAVAERERQIGWDHFRQTTNAWHDEIKANEVIGGSRYDTAMRTIATTIEQFLPQERQQQLYDRLRATGMGNDVNLALLLHTFGSMMGREATPVPAPEPRRPALTRQQRGESRYSGTTPGR